MWKLGANAKPGQISQSEFMSGMNALECDSLEKLKRLVETGHFDPGFLEDKQFRDFHKFVFQAHHSGNCYLYVALCEIRHLAPSADWLCLCSARAVQSRRHTSYDREGCCRRASPFGYERRAW